MIVSHDAVTALAKPAARELAPSGTLRAAINVGNSVLAQPGTDGGSPHGITVDLAHALARAINLPLEFVLYDAAGRVFAALERNEWDVAFLAVEPERASKLIFSQPYVKLEGTYLVRDRDQFQTMEDVDRPGVRISVAENAAYDLFLSRNLKHATLVRTPTPQMAYQTFLDRNADVVAGVREALSSYVGDAATGAVLTGQFSRIRQAICVPAGRNNAAAFIRDWMTDLKKTAFITDALLASGQAAGFADCET